MLAIQYLFIASEACEAEGTGCSFDRNVCCGDMVCLPMENSDPNTNMGKCGQVSAPLNAKSAPEGFVVQDPSENEFIHQHKHKHKHKDNLYILEEGFVMGLIAESGFVLLLVSLLYCIYRSSQPKINKQYDEISSDESSRV